MYYVCSDIHGCWNRYEQAIARLKKNDTLLVLGDVIDRGEDGIRILQDIMQQKNVQLLLGNHESMMLHSLVDAKWQECWLHPRNGGEPTYKELCKLSPSKQIEMVSFLHSLPICTEVEIKKDKKFRLSHGSFGGDAYSMVWESPFRNEISFPKQEASDSWNYVHGHVYVQSISPFADVERLDDVPYSMIQKDNTYLIDGGCALHNTIRDKDIPNALILFCLDTGEREYIR